MRMRASEEAGQVQVEAAREIASRFLEQRYKNEHNAARDVRFEARLMMQVRWPDCEFDMRGDGAGSCF